MAENFKYGLTIRKKEDKKVQIKNIFGENSDDEDNETIDPKKRINLLLKKQQEHNTIRIANEISKVLEEDSKIYEYDSIYDNISSNKHQYQKREIEEKKPKYIEAMKKQADKRKIETSIITERLEKKKRLEEDGQDKAKFVTKAYEEQINMNKKMELRHKFEEKYDKKYSVNEETGLMGFYSNLFTKNTDFNSGVRGEGEGQLVEQHKKRKELYTQMIEENYDKAIENQKMKIEEEKQKKKREEELRKKLEDKEKIEKLLSIPDAKEKNIQPETPSNVSNIDKKAISLEEKKELYKLKYLERKRKNEEKDLNLNNN